MAGNCVVMCLLAKQKLQNGMLSIDIADVGAAKIVRHVTTVVESA